MRKKCLIFDMDGVLVNTEPLHYRVWKQVFGEMGLEIDFEHYKGCIGSTIRTLFDIIEKEYNFQIRDEGLLRRRFDEVKSELIRQEGLPEIEGIRTAVRRLYDEGYTLAVASSSGTKYIEYNIGQLGLLDCFQLLCSGEDVVHPKPAPDIFLKVARVLEVSPKECIVIEDSHNGVLAAKAAGMQCLGFANPDSGDQDLSRADQIFYSFKDDSLFRLLD